MFCNLFSGVRLSQFFEFRNKVSRVFVYSLGAGNFIVIYADAEAVTVVGGHPSSDSLFRGPYPLFLHPVFISVSPSLSIMLSRVSSHVLKSPLHHNPGRQLFALSQSAPFLQPLTVLSALFACQTSSVAASNSCQSKRAIDFCGATNLRFLVSIMYFVWKLGTYVRCYSHYTQNRSPKNVDVEP